MKKRIIVLLLIALSVFISCSTIPEPRDSSESLITGSFVLDYPDGFHSGPKKTIDSNVTLKIYNRTTGKEYSKRTDNGFFTFIANAGDEIKIYEYYYQQTMGRTVSTTGGRLDKVFTVVDDKINYLGHIKVTYNAGNVVEQDRKNLTFHYNKNTTINYDSNAVQDYLSKELVESEWLEDGLEVVKYKR